MQTGDGNRLLTTYKSPLYDLDGSVTLAAMEAGMAQFDGSFGGLGGCPFVPNAAGNISTEDVLNMCDEMGIETGVDIVKVMELSRQMKELLGHDLDSYILRAGRAKDLIVG